MQLTSMEFNNFSNKRKPKPGAIGSSREKRGEQFSPMLFRHPRAGIAHPHSNELYVPVRFCNNSDRTAARRMMQGIVDQIAERLLEKQ